MVSRTQLQPMTARGWHRWRKGFINVFRAESGKWWETRHWWVQTLIWMVILNGLLAIVVWGGESEDIVAAGVEIFMPVSQVFGAIGISIMMQGIIVGEKQLGTAAWVLSKPVSRSAFVLAKAVATLVAALVIIVLIQAAVAFLQISAASGSLLPLVPFLAGVGMVALQMLFYLTLTLMLGTFFSTRGPVIGIAIAMIIIQAIQGLLPPWLLAILPNAMVAIAPLVVMGDPAPSVAAIIAVPIWSLVFTAVAVWRFQREEF